MDDETFGWAAMVDLPPRTSGRAGEVEMLHHLVCDWTAFLASPKSTRYDGALWKDLPSGLRSAVVGLIFERSSDPRLIRWP